MKRLLGLSARNVPQSYKKRVTNSSLPSLLTRVYVLKNKAIVRMHSAILYYPINILSFFVYLPDDLSASPMSYGSFTRLFMVYVAAPNIGSTCAVMPACIQFACIFTGSD
jgi:hypothetical protein